MNHKKHKNAQDMMVKDRKPKTNRSYPEQQHAIVVYLHDALHMNWYVCSSFHTVLVYNAQLQTLECACFG